VPVLPVVLPAVVPVLPVEPAGVVPLVAAAVVWSDAVVLLVCDVVGGMPAFALVAPTPVFALPEMFGVAPGVVLPVAPADVPAFAAVLEDGAVEL
jgi:hypothetical protein